MACTIVSTPSLGSSDWSTWITQQGLTDRGFMRVSLTNFATTAASAIGTGSVFELAGSIYRCTETAISLATGTASAAVSVYFVAIPVAGGTTCTFEMDSVAPTWIDAKQGFYASAASTTRYLGGAYIGTAATYYTKWIYTPDMVSGYLLPNGETRPILHKKVSIGEWNMDATNVLNVPHNISNWTSIRNIFVQIISDAEDEYSMIAGTDHASVQRGGVEWGSLNIVLRRAAAASKYDNTGYNATASTIANRGYIYVEYEA